MKEYIAEYIVPVVPADEKDKNLKFDFINAKRLIRCKDCKWYEFDRKMHCGLPHGVRSKDDYCSDAERKEE